MLNIYLLYVRGYQSNPVPKSSRTCTECSQVVARHHRATKCDSCSMWTHIICGGVQSKQYRQMKLTDNIWHTCRSCLEILQQFPFSNTSLNSSLSLIPNQHQTITTAHQFGLTMTTYLQAIKEISRSVI